MPPRRPANITIYPTSPPPTYSSLFPDFQPFPALESEKTDLERAEQEWERKRECFCGSRTDADAGLRSGTRAGSVRTGSEGNKVHTKTYGVDEDDDDDDDVVSRGLLPCMALGSLLALVGLRV